MKSKVLELLKPKVASYGFSEKSVSSFATQIAEDIDTDATDEEINAKVDAVIPFFKISQSEITRIVNTKKGDDVPPTENPPKKEEPKKPSEPTDKLDKLFALIEKQGEEIRNLTNKQVKENRKEIYAEKLKDLPKSLRESMIKKFDRISFKDAEDFETFLEEEEQDIPVILKEHSEAKLDEMGQPLRGGHAGKKEASDDEVDDIINNLNY